MEREADMEEELDEPEGTIIVKLSMLTALVHVGVLSSQTHVGFSYHLVINSTQLHYQNLFS